MAYEVRGMKYKEFKAPLQGGARGWVESIDRRQASGGVRRQASGVRQQASG